MTSDLKLAANRSNALLSTGPRTSVGKERSRLNARRHGLAQDIRNDPALRPEIEALAETLSRTAGQAIVSEESRNAAAAEFDLLRIRKLQSELTEELKKGRSIEERTSAQQKLIRLQRYERRAYSRRRRAIRRLSSFRR